MKREPSARATMIRHEAAHFVALQIVGAKPSHISWWRVGTREISHAEAAIGVVPGWEDPATRNATIAARAFAALAGGAWEHIAAGIPPGSIDARDIHRFAGAIDFELAHEWLTLQRHDGRQEHIEADIGRLFDAACLALAAPVQWQAIALVAVRFEAAIENAERRGREALTMAAHRLLQGIVLDAAPSLSLDATLAA